MGSHQCLKGSKLNWIQPYVILMDTVKCVDTFVTGLMMSLVK